MSTLLLAIYIPDDVTPVSVFLVVLSAFKAHDAEVIDFVGHIVLIGRTVLPAPVAFKGNLARTHDRPVRVPRIILQGSLNTPADTVMVLALHLEACLIALEDVFKLHNSLIVRLCFCGAKFSSFL